MYSFKMDPLSSSSKHPRTFTSSTHLSLFCCSYNGGTYLTGGNSSLQKYKIGKRKGISVSVQDKDNRTESTINSYSLQTCLELNEDTISYNITFKPIFHQNANPFALGPRVGLDLQRKYFALLIPTSWYIQNPSHIPFKPRQIQSKPQQVFHWG